MLLAALAFGVSFVCLGLYLDDAMPAIPSGYGDIDRERNRARSRNRF